MSFLFTPNSSNILVHTTNLPITVAARPRGLRHELFSPAQTFVIVGSNPIRGMDVCVLLFCVCVVLCAGSGLATGLSPVQGALPTV
jgi:hypothetical protein